MPSEIVRLRRAADRLGVCDATLRAMVRRGEIRAVKLGRRWLGFETEEIDRFVRARQVGVDRDGDATAPNPVQAQP